MRKARDRGTKGQGGKKERKEEKCTCYYPTVLLGFIVARFIIMMFYCSLINVLTPLRLALLESHLSIKFWLVKLNLSGIT